MLELSKFSENFHDARPVKIKQKFAWWLSKFSENFHDLLKFSENFPDARPVKM